MSAHNSWLSIVQPDNKGPARARVFGTGEAPWLVGTPLKPYRIEPARAILSSVFGHRGLTFTVMVSRQAGTNELSAAIEAYLIKWSTTQAYLAGPAVAAPPSSPPPPAWRRRRPRQNEAPLSLSLTFPPE